MTAMGEKRSLRVGQHPAKYLVMRNTIPAVVAVLFATLGCSGSAPSSCPSVLPGWATPTIGQPVHHVANVVTAQGGLAHWNGVRTDEKTLSTYLLQTATMDPLPFVIFDPQGTDCESATRLRDIMDRNYPCRDGACGQGSRADFERASYKETGRPPA
jgi:hypothetical protein